MENLNLSFTRKDAIVLSFAARASIEKLEEISKKYGDAIDYTINAYRPVLKKFEEDVNGYLKSTEKSEQS